MTAPTEGGCLVEEGCPTPIECSERANCPLADDVPTVLHHPTQVKP